MFCRLPHSFVGSVSVHGKEVATKPDDGDGDGEQSTGRKEPNNVTCEARLLKSLVLRQLEY